MNDETSTANPDGASEVPQADPAAAPADGADAPAGTEPAGEDSAAA